MPTTSLLVCLSGHQDEITGARLLDDVGNLVASSAKDGTVRISPIRYLFFFPSHKPFFLFLPFFHIQIGFDKHYVWDLRAGVQIAKQYSHAPGVEVTCFLSNPNKLVTGLLTGEVAY
jgi:WD40 repeat protein